MAEPVRLIHDNSDTQLELPKNVEAEAALLGAIMIDNRIAEDVQLKLRAEHFFEPGHGRIYDAIMTLSARSMVANPLTLKPMFGADEAMKALGGPAYLAQLTGSGAALIGARDFASQIYDLALLRELVSVGRDMATRALDTSEAVLPTSQIEEAEMALYRVAEQGGETGSVKSFVQATTEAVRLAEKAMNSGGGLSGVTTGLEGLNGKTGGLHHSDLLILAGRRLPPTSPSTPLHAGCGICRMASRPRNRWVRRSRSSASKCRRTSWRRVSCRNSRGSWPKTFVPAK